MKNLMNFFFSFDKLMKEKLIVPFFWLAMILAGLYFSNILLETIWLGPLAKVLQFITFFVAIVFTLVGIRLLCELMVAIFRINNNLSPDGGKSETADIDPMIEARKAAEAAALRAREVTKTAGEKASAATKSAVEKTKSAADSAKDSVSDAAGSAVNRTRSAANDMKSTVSAKTSTSKASTKTAQAKTTTTKTKTSKKTSAKKAPAKKASTKKAAPKKASTKKTVKKKSAPKKKTAKKSTTSKLDPSLYATDKKGNIIFNKDGSPRKKPGRPKGS